MAPDNKWQKAEATIFSAEWIEPEGKQRGCWRVTYSYWVGPEIYSGELTDFATDEEVTYTKDDKLTIEYSLRNPAKSRVPGIITYWQKAKVPFAIGAALGLIMLLYQLLSGHWR